MKYLTKGELLVLLGSNADKFTEFMIDPSKFGITEPLLGMIKVAKQKFDWTNSIDLSLPELQSMFQLLVSVSVLSSQNVADILAVADRSTDGSDIYLIVVRAQDNITNENIYGSHFDGNMWQVKASIKNNTTNFAWDEDFCFDKEPTENDIRDAVDSYIKDKKRV